MTTRHDVEAVAGGGALDSGGSPHNHAPGGNGCVAPDTIDARKVEAVDALLPQTQCRRCGYVACRPYAEAMVHGEADINRCPPGGETTIEALARTLGRPVLALDPACGTAGPRETARIDESLCIGCVVCIRACPVDAIIGARKWMHAVLESECTGCGLCVEPCPMDCIAMVPARVGPATPEAWLAGAGPARPAPLRAPEQTGIVDRARTAPPRALSASRCRRIREGAHRRAAPGRHRRRGGPGQGASDGPRGVYVMTPARIEPRGRRRDSQLVCADRIEIPNQRLPRAPGPNLFGKHRARVGAMCEASWRSERHRSSSRAAPFCREWSRYRGRRYARWSSRLRGRGALRRRETEGDGVRDGHVSDGEVGTARALQGPGRRLRAMNAAGRRAIFERLRAGNPSPTTELEYSTPFELLIAVVLSAQATDVSRQQGDAIAVLRRLHARGHARSG